MKRADILIVILALALLPVLYARYWGDHGAPGERVEIWAGGELWGRYALHADQALRVPGRTGESAVSIRDGQARFTHSSCRDKVCVHSGWLTRGGEVAACLPNGVSLRIAARDPAFDSVNF